MYHVTYPDLVEICTLLDRLQSDLELYLATERIADTIVGDRRRSRFTPEQRADIAKRLDQLANAKLPNPRFITHAGYKVACQANILRIRDSRKVAWEQLIADAKQIASVADRAFVFAIIASALPSREAQLRSSVVAETRAIMSQIPSAYDRGNRLRMLAESIAETDRQSCNQLLRDAMREVLNVPGQNATKLQRNVIDFAYRLDPDFATKLVALADDDPARLARRRELREHLELLDAKRELSAPAMAAESTDKIADDKFPAVAWRALGSLNSHQLVPLGHRDLRPHITRASRLSLSDAYPILSWVYSNFSLKYSDTDHASRLLRPVFEANLAACHLCQLVVKRAANRTFDFRLPTSAVSEQSLLVPQGAREAAVAFIKQWLAAHASGYLKIADPYFGPDELEILLWVLETKPDLQVSVLTSVSHARALTPPIDEAYRSRWRLHLSASEPPNTEVTIVGTKGSGDSPIHDRWIISNRTGLRIGTSLNSLGLTKDSDISVFNADEALEREAQIDRYLLRTSKEHRGERLIYSTFTL